MFFSTALNGSVNLALERGPDDTGTPLGNHTLATDLQTQKEGRRRSGGLQKEVITSIASHTDEVESSDDGGTMPKQFGRQRLGLLMTAAFPS